MSLKNKINSENPLIDLKGLNEYHSRMSALQEANANKIAQIVGELAGATAQLAKTTTKVNCDHRYEITGNTGDEHGLAITDQQMLINKISGRTLVKNQLFDYTKIQSETRSGVTITNNNDGTITLNGTATSNVYANLYITCTFLNHSIVMMPSSFNPSLTRDKFFYYFNIPYMPFYIDDSLKLAENVNIDNRELWMYILEGTTLNNVVLRPQLIDLTLAYGAGNEPTTIEEVLNDFPEYISYDEGMFVHSNNELISTGRNLFKVANALTHSYNCTYTFEEGRITLTSTAVSGDTKYALIKQKLRPNKRYYVNYNDVYKNIGLISLFEKTLSGAQLGVVNGELLYGEGLTHSIADNKFFETRDGSEYYLLFYLATNANVGDKVVLEDFVITAEENPIYEPYKEEVIKGVGELKQWDYKDNQSGNDVFGTGELDLGNLDWYLDGSQRFSTELPIEDAKVPESGFYSTLLCEKYTPSNDPIGTTGKDKTIAIYLNKYLYLYDFDYTDATSLKQALRGVKLLYEKATPTIVKNNNLPAGMSVYKGGLQEQKGTIPYVIEKQYALSVASQVLQNIEIDREQQEQIDNMKGDIAHKQPLLFSGQNIKTFNGKSILGSGDLAWNDPMFLAKFNNVTNYTKENGGVIDEVLEGKTYRIYSDNDVSSSIYSFDVRLKLKISSGETKMYTIALPTKTKNFVDFRLDNIVLNGQRATLYYNVDNVDYTQLLTQQGDAVTGDYEMYGWGALYLSGTYAAVFEPVELLTKEDLVEIKPIQSIKETLTVGERGEINLSKMPILIKPIYMYNKTKGNSYYLFYELSSASNKCMKNGRLKEISEIFYSLSLYPTDDTKAIEFNQSEYDYGDIIEIIYEYGYVDPAIFIEA